MRRADPACLGRVAAMYSLCLPLDILRRVRAMLGLRERLRMEATCNELASTMRHMACLVAQSNA